MITEAIATVVSGQALTQGQAAQAMEDIMSGEATPAQIASFATALRMKGETVEEIAGLAQVMREKSVHVSAEGYLLDTCGTGGDGAGTFNVSTAAAFVAAGAGIKVAKHGNRAMSSQCGSADVLEALGVKIDLGPEAVKTCLDQVGIGFMYAPQYHPAMKAAAGPRREIGVRTVFNLLGPLTNPAGATAQVLGVPDKNLIQKIGEVMELLGSRHVLVVHGEDGMDEVSISVPTYIYELFSGGILVHTIAPEDFAYKRAPASAVAGGSAADNAAIIRSVLEGERGPQRDFVILNAAAALVAGEKVFSFKEGVWLAEEIIDQGLAMDKLEAWVELSQKLGE